LRLLHYLFFVCFFASRAVAVEPFEILNDTELEDRARELSSIIRCLVCQNENIDSSDSEFAKDLRLFIRDQLIEGHTDEEIREFLVSKYGGFILFKPAFAGYNIFLYLFGPFVFIFGLITILFLFFKSKKGH
jgi:cytochrome c-type biogenesis protein CcmH